MRELVQVPQNEQNLLIKLNDYIIEKKISGFKGAFDKVFYPYNHDIKNYSWGCAWRAIQTVISQKHTEFKNLFQQYAKEQTLNKLISNKYTNQSTLKQLQQTKTKWCPQHSTNGWAEPFIGKLVLDSFQIKNQLHAVNNIPQFANAPKGVFDKILNFQEFKQKIISHFDNNGGPIFIDDASYSMCIWGYKNNNNCLSILLADPHIKSNRIQKFTGIYQVSLNENGSQINNSVSPSQKEHFGYPTYQAIKFNNKNWMVLFPQI